jgi:hypothetical protein
VKRRLLVLIVAIAIVLGIVLVSVQSASMLDNGGVGGRARDFVKGPFTNIVFEIDYFSDIQTEIVPDETRVATFLAFVEKYTGKDASVVYQTMPTELATTGHWDATELRALDAQTRSIHSLPLFTLSVHIIYANALHEPPNNGIAGLSIGATTIVVFKGLFAIAVPDAEAPILAHEFGHLLGLCGLVGDDPSKICDGTGHALDPMSLMAAAIDTRVTNVRLLLLTEQEIALLAAL